MSEVLLFYSDETPETFIFSNFYPHGFKSKSKQKFKPLNIMYEGVSWPTSEHLYQALKFKCETEDEKRWREIIRTSSTPTKSKYLGHFFTHVKYSWQRPLRDLVNEYKDKVRLAGEMHDGVFRQSIMKIALEAKYDSSEEFRDALEKTRNFFLGENTTDEWGYHSGKNWLGNMLMELRDSQL